MTVNATMKDNSRRMRMRDNLGCYKNTSMATLIKFLRFHFDMFYVARKRMVMVGSERAKKADGLSRC
jgi:hypothetical protein